MSERRKEVTMSNDLIRCLDASHGDCKGEVQYRMPLSASGISYPRCQAHWEDRLQTQEDINRRYPTLPPADFDPLYAGESWDED
jgi:hypothetical protein